jgi:hypothetical protein
MPQKWIWERSFLTIHGPGLGFARCKVWICIVGFGVRCTPMDSIVLAFSRYWQHFWRAALGWAFG